MVYNQLNCLKFQKNDTIIKQGDIGDKYYLLASGKVQVILQDGFTKTIHPGSGFGELAILYG